MNIVDLVIILLAITGLTRGRGLGLVRQLGSTLGLVVGLVLGSWVGGLLLSPKDSTVGKASISLGATLLGGFVVMGLGELAGVLLKQKIVRVRSLDRFDGIFGALVGVVTMVFGLWLGASILALGPSSGVQQAVKSSRILASLNATLPPATSLLSSLNKLIDPNGFPQVFNGLEPSLNPTVSLPDLGSFNPVVQAAEASVLQVEGTGCGGIVEGSSFIIDTRHVATNAHVVAGVANPKVMINGTAHNTEVVWFDPNVDLAVLQVDGLSGKPLALNTTTQASGAQGVVLGYPGGGSFNAQPAAIMEHFTALGRNIYGQGATARNVYSLKAHIIPGNSGGPLIGADGTVLGIVFATSTTYNDVGYALTGAQVASELTTGAHSTTIRSTGACSE